MEIIIAIIIIFAILSALKDFVCDHKKGVLIFLGIVAGIVLLVIGVKKLGAWKVVVILLVLSVCFGIISFIIRIITSIVNWYYNRKAKRIEGEVWDYVMSKPSEITYKSLLDGVNSLYAEVRLGKHHNVRDYINAAVDNFVNKNINIISQFVQEDILRKGCVERGEYIRKMNIEMGGYCIGNNSFEQLVEDNVKKVAQLSSWGNSCLYKVPGITSGENYHQTIIEDDDDDDDEYITYYYYPNGGCYHTNQFCNGSCADEIDEDEIIDRGLKPCGRCVKDYEKI